MKVLLLSDGYTTITPNYAKHKSDEDAVKAASKAVPGGSTYVIVEEADVPERPVNAREAVISELDRLDAKSSGHTNYVIRLLVSKGVFSLTDIPKEVQDRYAEWLALRAKLA